MLLCPLEYAYLNNIKSLLPLSFHICVIMLHFFSICPSTCFEGETILRINLEVQ